MEVSSPPCKASRTATKQATQTKPAQHTSTPVQVMYCLRAISLAAGERGGEAS